MGHKIISMVFCWVFFMFGYGIYSKLEETEDFPLIWNKFQIILIIHYICSVAFALKIYKQEIS